MSDGNSRNLERRFRETGDTPDGLRLMYEQLRVGSLSFYKTAMNMLDRELSGESKKNLEADGLEKITTGKDNSYVVKIIKVNQKENQEQAYGGLNEAVKAPYEELIMVGFNFLKRINERLERTYAVKSFQDWKRCGKSGFSYKQRYGNLIDLKSNQHQGYPYVGLDSVQNIEGDITQVIEGYSSGIYPAGVIVRGISNVQKITCFHNQSDYNLAGTVVSPNFGSQMVIMRYVFDLDEFEICRSEAFCAGVVKGLEVQGEQVILAHNPSNKRNRAFISSYTGGNLNRIKQIKLHKNEKFNIVSKYLNGNILTLTYDKEPGYNEEKILREWFADLEILQEHKFDLPSLSSMEFKKESVYVGRNSAVYKLPNIIPST